MSRVHDLYISKLSSDPNVGGGGGGSAPAVVKSFGLVNLVCPNDHGFLPVQALPDTPELMDDIKDPAVATLSPLSVNFTNPSRYRLTYTGTTTGSFKVIALVGVRTVDDASTPRFYLAKNGAVIPETKRNAYCGVLGMTTFVPLSTFVSLATGDYIEIWRESNDAVPVYMYTPGSILMVKEL